MKFQLVIILVVTILNVMVNARPMDKEDECLLTCEYCFKDEVLLNCANQCLITPHNMGHPWLTICPYFGYVGFSKR